jgi:hypothetical protein
MATTTAVSPNETPIVAEAIETGTSWVRRAAGKVKGFFAGVWNGVKSFFRWIKGKVIDGYNWTKDKVVRGKDKVVKGARWSWNKAKEVWDWFQSRRRDLGAGIWSVLEWGGRAVRTGWRATVDTLKGTWLFTEPFRSWLVATPFRVAAGATAGIAALTWGGAALLGLSIPWVVFLLISGRKTAKEQSAVNELAAPDFRQLSSAQSAALNARALEIRDSGERYGDAGDKNMSSEYAGRLYLVQQRGAGSTETVNQLTKLHKDGLVQTMGKLDADKLFTWTAVKRGIQEEDKVVRRLMAEAVVVPEPTPTI